MLRSRRCYRLPLFLALLLLAAAGCGRGRSTGPLAKPQATKEGETWSCDDLASYLRERGVRLFQVGDLHPGRGGLPDTAFFADDTALTARKGNPGIIAALRDSKVGIILVTRHPTAEGAKRQTLPADKDSYLLWGRFLIVVSGPLPEEAEVEETPKRIRSKRLVKAIREALSP